MTNPTNDKQRDVSERAAYEAPAIIYEGELTTRAGSLFPGAEYDVAPEKLFGGAS